MVTATKRWRN